MLAWITIPLLRPPLGTVPRHGEAADQAAELAYANTHGPAPAFAALAGFAAKNQKRFPASHARDCIGLSACAG